MAGRKASRRKNSGALLPALGFLALGLAILLLLDRLYPKLTAAPEHHTVVYEEGDLDEAQALSVSFLDVGQGDAILIEAPTGETALIDAGPNTSETQLLSFLDRHHIKELDYAVFTHMHEDHIGGADRVFGFCRVGTVLLSPVSDADSSSCTRLKAAAAKEGCEVLYAQPGQRFSIGTAELTVLAPLGGSYENGNDAGLVLRLTCGEHAFLFMGDAEAVSEEELLRTYDADALRADVIKLGHHGSSSSTSEALLDAVKPSIAVASCGIGNEFGHPHKEIIDRLHTRSILFLRTDADGTVRILSDGHALRADTEKNG